MRIEAHKKILDDGSFCSYANLYMSKEEYEKQKHKIIFCIMDLNKIHNLDKNIKKDLILMFEGGCHFIALKMEYADFDILTDEQKEWLKYSCYKDNAMPYHIENIKCPNCNTIQEAKVIHKIPFYDYTHECEKCKYIIMESEWENV